MAAYVSSMGDAFAHSTVRATLTRQQRSPPVHDAAATAGPASLSAFLRGHDDTMASSHTVRWSPHSSSSAQRFLRINSREHELTFYDVESTKGRNITVRQAARHSKIPYIRCFDWSPLDEDLVSVGQSSGEALLLRISDTTSTPIPLAVKHQRSCNSVSFNADGRFIATGLDKVRNDFCLNIWDIHQRLGQFASDTARPCRQLASSEAITSVRFSRDNGNTLVAGVAYRFLRVFDLRESPSNPAISCHTRCVHGISLDRDPNYFASHSDDGIVSVWDRRFARSSQSAEPALLFNRPDDSAARGGGQISSLRYSWTRDGAFAVLNTAGGLRVYETMKVSDQEPLSSASSMALLASMGAETVAVDTHKPRSGWRESASSLLEAGRAYGGTSTSGTRTPTRTDGETLFVTRITDLVSPSKAAKPDRRIGSFDWIKSGDGWPGESLRILALRNDGSLEILSCPDPVPTLAWGSRNEVVITSDKDLKMIPAPDTRSEVLEEKSRSKSITPEEDVDGSEKYTYSAGGGSPEQRLGLHEKRRNERSNSVVRPEDYLLDAEEVLKNDICVTMKRRVEQGYEMTCHVNAMLTEDRGEDGTGNRYLNEMWTWLDGARECAVGGGMTSGPLDLSYLGVYGVWNGGKEPTLETRLTTSKRVGRDDWTKAAAKINEASDRKPFTDCPTEFPEQRRLCLAICDWNFDKEELEFELQELEREDKHTKAASWALFCGDMDRCLRSLRSGGQSLRILATAVAGYTAAQRSETANGHSEWKIFATDLATELHDPYMRAIFGYVSSGDWKEVLDDIGLPLRERIGIALRWLPDDDLTNFLDTATKRAIDDGELEGIVLTGVTPQAIDLLQAYINKTGDVQTAALVSSFAHPKYFTQKDDRVMYWVESYRQLLNRWRKFHARARFDVERGKHSKNRNGVMTMEASQRQVYVRCANCDRSISHNVARNSAVKKDSKPMTLREKQAATATNAAPVGSIATKPTVCPHCKKSLPRCAVCLLNLGAAVGKKAGEATDPEEDYDRWFNFCLACNHGMHAGHAKEWFDKHRVCPVPDCACCCKM